MLKIKDNIPIKVVEKFGFEYRAEEKAYCKEIENSYERIEIVMNNDEYCHQIRLYINNEYYECWTSENSFDIIYDLIKADLVEKIGEIDNE
jgi:hypothetical protein